MRPTTIVLLLGLAVLLPIPAALGQGVADAPPPEEVSDLEVARNTALEKLTKELEKIATWCEENDMKEIRDVAYESLILFSIDHKVARKALRYFRKDGENWEQRGYKRPRNKHKNAPALEPELRAKIEALRSEFVASLLGAIDEAGEDADYDLVKILVADILKVEPDNAKAHDLIGETNLDGKWVLKETKRAKERTKELREAAQKLIEDADDLEKIDPNEVEKQLGLDWEGGYQGVWWRGLGTVPAESVRQTVKVMDASAPFFGFMFGFEVKPPKGCGVYLLTGKKDAKRALTNHPNFRDSEREYLIGLRAAWVPRNGQKQEFFQWSDNPGVQLDGSVRMAIGILFQRTFGISTDKGWLWEGGGLYLDYKLTGSHRVVFVTRDIHTTTKRELDFDIETRMKDPSANWVLLARRLAEANVEPDLFLLTRKPVNNLSPEDLVYAYALFSYIVEGFPDKAPRFLMFTEERIDRAVEKNFEYDLDEFLSRFHRWLEEMT